MRKPASLLLTATFALLAERAIAQPASSYQAGVNDRTTFEQWYEGLTGDYRAGAEYWVAHRSIPKEAHCASYGVLQEGCLAAQGKLAPFDARRKADPDYRLGWNGAPRPGLASAAGLNETSQPALKTERIYYVQHDTFGCLNSADTLLLTNPVEQRRSDPTWVSSFTWDRRCVPISPRSPWRLIRHDGDVALMSYAGTSSPPGLFYLRESDLSVSVIFAMPPTLSPELASSGAAQQSERRDTNARSNETTGATNTPDPPPSNETRSQSWQVNLPPNDNSRSGQTTVEIAPSTNEPPRAIASGQNSSEESHGVVVVFAIIVMLFGGFFFAKKRAAKVRLRKALAVAVNEIYAKAHLLHVRREQLTQPDYYGTRDYSNWEKEKVHFTNTRIIPHLNEVGLSDLITEILPALYGEIEVAACRPIEPSTTVDFSNPAVYSPKMDPVDYEMHCALQLQKAGWTTKATPRTGDQGADILAERGGETLVVQCKLYANNVGNAAVQEAVAARVFHRAQLAVVVSNAPFTKSARELAGMSDVTLLHHSELRAYTGRHGPAAGLGAAN